MIGLAFALAGLLYAARVQWQKMAPERAKARRARAIRAAMESAMTDDHRCGLCGEVSAIRELVPLADGACVACLACTPLLKPMKVAA
jgi:hypothetical protein